MKKLKEIVFDEIMDDIHGIKDLDILIHWMEYNKDRVCKLNKKDYKIVVDKLYKKIVKK